MKPVSCKKAVALIEASALELTNDAEATLLDGHLAQCPACREIFEQNEQVIAGFRSAFAMSGDHESNSETALLAKLRWRVQCESSAIAYKHKMRRRWLVVTAIAATVAIIAGATLFFEPSFFTNILQSNDEHPWELTNVQTTDAGGLLRPLVHDRYLIALRTDEHGKTLTVVKRHDGTSIWHARDNFEGGPATDGNFVFAWLKGSDGTRELAAYALNNGKLRWQQKYPDTSKVLRPREIVASAQGVGWVDRNRLYWLDPQNGQCRWSIPLNPGQTPRPKLTLSGDCLVVADTRDVTAFEMSDGKIRWSQGSEQVLAGWLEPRLTSDEHRVVIIRTMAPNIDLAQCIKTETGQLCWSRELKAPVQHLLLQNDMLFARGQKVTALEGKSGNEMWSMPVDGCSPVTLVDGCLYLIAGARGLMAIDPHNGKQLWRYDHVVSCSGLSVAGNFGYVRTSDGVLHAIPLNQQWEKTKERQAANSLPPIMLASRDF